MSIDKNSQLEETTQFGIRTPDGREHWDYFKPDGRDTYSASHFQKDWGKHPAMRTLVALARAANVDPEQYLHDHKLITRKVTTITGPTETIHTLQPMPEPAKEQEQ